MCACASVCNLGGGETGSHNVAQDDLKLHSSGWSQTCGSPPASVLITDMNSPLGFTAHSGVFLCHDLCSILCELYDIWSWLHVLIYKRKVAVEGGMRTFGNCGLSPSHSECSWHLVLVLALCIHDCVIVHHSAVQHINLQWSRTLMEPYVPNTPAWCSLP